MTKKELIDLARRIMECEGTEDEIERMSELFDRNVPHPSGINLAYFPEDYGVKKNLISEEEYDPTPEEVVEMCLNPNVIIMKPPNCEQGS